MVVNHESLKELLPFYLGLYIIIKLGFQLATFKWLNYYDLRQSLPLMLFFFSLCLKTKIKIRKYLYLIGASTILGIILLRVGGYFDRLLIKSVTGMPWGYWIYIEYGMFAMIYVELFSRKTETEFRALAYTMLLLPVIGLMYEFPNLFTNITRQWFSLGTPFFIRSSVVGLALIVWKYGYSSFKQKRVLVLCLLLASFYLFLSLNSTINMDERPYRYLVRLPTLTFWAVMIYFWKGERQTRLNG